MTILIEETHPELFHYTGIAGLMGIVKYQTLWATHAAFLNDVTEIRAFQERLPDFLRPNVNAAIAELVRRVPANQALIDQHGGIDKAVVQTPIDITTGMFNALLGTEDSQAFAEPFVMSFCTAAATGDISRHGLLSQWRGYGQEGGYSLVFDTSRLVQLLKEEGEKWRFDLFGGDVVYSSETDEELREELGEDIDAIATSISEWVGTGGSPESLENVYPALIRCACRYKHWGFHEEKEVRIIAIPPNKELFEEQKARGLVVTEKPRRHFTRAGTPVPCIHLFEGITHLPEKPLPITRVIVGPHRDKDKRRQAVERLLSQYHLDIPVTVSDIPYVGHF